MSAVAKTGREVNRADLAMLLGKSLPTIDAMVRRGCPFVSRGNKGREWSFDTAAVIDWLRQRDVEDAIGNMDGISLEEAKRRDLIAGTQIKEYELARIRRQTVFVSEIAETIADEYAIVRSRMMEMPGRVAQQLAAETDPSAVEALLKAEVADALSELSADDGTGDADDI
jgi:phage terminase Nu1 subunit (DNA packaging protein)